MRARLFLLLSCLILTASNPGSPAWPRLQRFEPMRIPIDNPMTREKVALGKKLFFDLRLSADQSTSCSGCHEPQ